jgi:hypothetical protein
MLAVEAWKLEHDGLPAHLDEVLGGELQVLPVEPIDGEPFGYFPDGLPRDFFRWSGKRPEKMTFLWSAGDPAEEVTKHGWWITQRGQQAYFIGR